MPKLGSAYGFEGEQRGECCSCGSSIPISDIILEKFQRCYYCGRSNPFGTKWRSLLTPIVVIAACEKPGCQNRRPAAIAANDRSDNKLSLVRTNRTA